MRAAVVIAVVAFGCDTGRPASPPRRADEAPLASPAHAPIDAIAIAVASPPDATPPPDAAPIALPRPSSGWIDKPAWPAGKHVTLTWLLYPIVLETYHGMENTGLQPLQLEATVAGVTRVATFVSQFGALEPYNQAACRAVDAHPDDAAAYPLARGEVGKITYYEGGAGGILVRRAAPDVVVLVDWSLGDGACDDAHGHFVPCKQNEKVVARMHVPAGATFTEAIVEIDAAGARHAYDCKQ